MKRGKVTTRFMTKGCDLRPSVQAKALARFVHRYTGEHKPDWVKRAALQGQKYPVQFANDTDWLAHTEFQVTLKGELDERVSFCHSSPTWPFNPELRNGKRTDRPLLP